MRWLLALSLLAIAPACFADNYDETVALCSHKWCSPKVSTPIIRAPEDIPMPWDNNPSSEEMVFHSDGRVSWVKMPGGQCGTPDVQITGRWKFGGPGEIVITRDNFLPTAQLRYLPYHFVGKGEMEIDGRRLVWGDASEYFPPRKLPSYVIKPKTD